MSDQPSEKAEKPEESGVADAVRAAVERTLQATSPAASQTRQRAGELLDEVSRVRREAGAELSRRSQEISKKGQEAGQGLARIGQEATSELTKRLELLEKRLASLESSLKGEETDQSQPKAKG